VIDAYYRLLGIERRSECRKATTASCWLSRVPAANSSSNRLAPSAWGICVARSPSLRGIAGQARSPALWRTPTERRTFCVTI